MKLLYKAVTKEGKIVRGLIEAKDVQEAGTFLRRKELLPITVTPQTENALTKYLPFLNRSTSSDVVFFTRQLASMLSSGLTLMQSLTILKEQMENQTMVDTISAIISDIEEGKSFSLAISKYPSIFSPIYISLIKAAETSGLLDKILLRLADNLEKQEKLKGTIRSALLYPTIIAILMVVVMVIMMVFVIPQVSALYENLNVPLPLPTRIVVGLSKFFIIFWPLIIGLIVLVIVLYKRWHSTEGGRLIMDDFLLKLPIFGKLIKQSILSEFSRTFGLLIGTGNLVVDSLVKGADVSGNVIYKNAILAVSARVEKGVAIGDAMSAYALFPPILIQMVKIGEQTGKLDESLLKVSEYFEREVEQTVKTLTTSMEPFIMIVLGVGVAFLIISIITPIYNLISTFQ